MASSGESSRRNCPHAPIGIPVQFLGQNDNTCSACLRKLVGDLLGDKQRP